MRKYVVGYFSRVAAEEDFVVLATMDSYLGAMFVRDSYNEAYKTTGVSAEAVLLSSCEVPKKYRFSEE